MTGHDAIAIIEKIGLTQRQFALLSGQHPNTISKWAGGCAPSPANATVLRLLDTMPDAAHVLRHAAIGASR
jgi:DNA-binding transcriptional regulator YiaG